MRLMDSRGPDRRQKSLDPLVLADDDRDVPVEGPRYRAGVQTQQHDPT